MTTNNQESPLAFRRESRREIVQIKQEIDALEKGYKTSFDAWIEENKNAGYESTITSEHWVKKEELQKQLTDLRKKLNEHFDHFKHDPTIINPSVKGHEEELEYLQSKMKWVDEKLIELNSQARDEFFEHGAIKGDGSENEKYFQIRNEIDPLIKKRNTLPEDEADQYMFTNESKMKAENIYESNEYKTLDSKLERFMSEELAPSAIQDSLDRARAFLAFCKERGEMIELEPLIKQYEEVAISMRRVRNNLDWIAARIAEQGLKVKPEDLKPYIEKIKQERQQ